MRIAASLAISLIIHFVLAALIINKAERIKLNQFDKTPPVEVQLLESKGKKNQFSSAAQGLQKANKNKLTKNWIRNGQGSPLSVSAERDQSTQLVKPRNGLKELAKKLLTDENSIFNQPENRAHSLNEEKSFNLNHYSQDGFSPGKMNILNSDPGEVYFTFYKRISDLAVYRWTHHIFLAINHFNPDQLKKMMEQDKVWSTHVEFLLTPDGRFHAAHIMKESGIFEFDRAGVMAFKEAGFFPNPPREMIDEDGFIRLKVSFNVILNPSMLLNQ